jgi:hypothetical protein
MSVSTEGLTVRTITRDGAGKFFLLALSTGVLLMYT